MRVAGDDQSLVRTAGLTYFPIAIAARLPFAMMVVGMLTLVVSERGSLALAGATSAAAGAGTAVFGPMIGAAADRWGQRAVLLVSATLNAVSLASLTWTAASDAPDVAVLLNAVLIGATAPQVAPMSRSRLVGIIARGFVEPRRSSVMSGTMAYESAADEVVFVFGPVIVGVLATTLGPSTPVLLAAVLTLVSVAAFALHPSERPAERDRVGGTRSQAPARQLLRFGLLVVLVGTFGMGLFFGGILTSLTSFMADRGMAEQAGVVYGAMGISSTVVALSAAWFPRWFTLALRWLVFAGVLVVGTLLLLIIDSVPAAALALLVIGVGVGPTLVGLYHLAADRAPRGRSATVMTMLGSGVVVGQATAAAVTGGIAQTSGTAAALLVPAVAAGVVLTAGVVNAVLARERPGGVAETRETTGEGDHAP